MEGFEAQTKPARHVDEAIERVTEFFRDRLRSHLDKKLDEPPPEGADVLGFIVGGYDKSGVGHLKTLNLPTETVVPGAATAAGECRATWEGGDGGLDPTRSPAGAYIGARWPRVSVFIDKLGVPAELVPLEATRAGEARRSGVTSDDIRLDVLARAVGEEWHVIRCQLRPPIKSRLVRWYST